MAVLFVALAAAVMARAAPVRHGAPMPAAFSADEVDVVARALLMARGDLLPLHADKPTFTHLLLAGSYAGLYAVRWAGSAGSYTLEDFERDFFLAPFPFYLAGRTISLLASLGTLALLAWLLRGRPAWAAAGGVLLLAWGGSTIHYAHVAKEDALGTLLAFASFAAAAVHLRSRPAEGADWKQAPLLASAVFAGLAVSTKYNLFFAGLFPLVAWWCSGGRWRPFLAVAVAGFAGFALGTPAVVANPGHYFRETLSAPILTQVAGGYNILQYSENRGPGFLWQIAWREWGPGLAALAVGLVAFAWRVREHAMRLLFFLPAGVYAAVLAVSSQLDFHYALPLAPIMAWAAAEGFARLAPDSPEAGRLAGPALAVGALSVVAMVAWSGERTWQVRQDLREGDARLRAAAFLQEDLGLADAPPERPLLILSNYAYRYHPAVALDRESYERLLAETLAAGGSGRYFERAARYAAEAEQTPLPARFLAFDTRFWVQPDGTREFAPQRFPLDPEEYAGDFSLVIVPSHTTRLLEFDAPEFRDVQDFIRAMVEMPLVAEFTQHAALGPSVSIHKAPD